MKNNKKDYFMATLYHTQAQPRFSLAHLTLAGRM